MFGDDFIKFVDPRVIQMAKDHIEQQKQWENKDPRFNSPKVLSPVEITAQRKKAKETIFTGGTMIILAAIAILIISKN